MWIRKGVIILPTIITIQKSRKMIIIEKGNLSGLFNRSSVILLIALITISNNSWGQNKVKITGRIFNKETGEVLPFTDVFVRGTNWGDMADDKGYYELQLPAGRYELIVSRMGYKTFVQIVDLKGDDDLSLDLYLFPRVLHMPGVTVIASKTVRQRQNESVSSLAFNTKKIKEMPFTLNDVNRALKTLPGITSNNGKSSEFNVRGGSFDENLVQVDGIKIYEPFHMKNAPYTSVSILNMDIMEEVNLFTGGFPARFGDKMSSVLDIKYRSGNRERFRSQIEIGGVRLNTLLEGPIGQKGSWIVGFNKSYIELAMKVMEKYKIAPKFYMTQEPPRFYDLQGKIDFELGKGHQGEFLFLNSGDFYNEDIPWYSEAVRIDLTPSMYTTMRTYDYSFIDAHYRNTLLALKLLDRVAQNLLLETSLSYYDILENYNSISIYEVVNRYYNYDDEYLGFTSSYSHTKWNNYRRTSTLELKNDLTFRLNPFRELEAGFSVQSIRYLNDGDEFAERLAYGGRDTTKIDTLYVEDISEKPLMKVSTYKMAGYVQDSWQLSDRLFTTLGIRIDYFDFNKDVTFSPRLSCSYTLRDGSIFKLAWGYYYQSPALNEFKFPKACSENTRSQRAIHYIAGYQRKLSNSFELKIDVYYKDYQDLISYYWQGGRKFSTKENDTLGFAKGVDLQLKYNLSKISGWLSYGFLIAKEDVKNDHRGFYPRPTDQRHSLAAVAEWNITPKWRLYGKFLYGSGFPYTPMIFDVNRYSLTRGAKNSEYLPSYKRVDLRILRDFSFNWGRLSIYIEIINIFNNKNVLYYRRYRIDQHGRIVKDARTLLPRLPNLGIKVYFR